MNIVLWVLQVFAALLYGASGVMFDNVNEGVRSFDAEESRSGSEFRCSFARLKALMESSWITTRTRF